MPGYPNDGYCGQNVFLKSSSNPFPDIAVGEAVASWFNEVVMESETGNCTLLLQVNNFDGTEIEDYGEAGHSTGEVDHFTAVVWAQTNAIGCGYVVWRDSSGTEFLAGLDYHQLIVCNYCPGPGASRYLRRDTRPLTAPRDNGQMTGSVSLIINIL